jgi:Tol biopolymer transport system component
MDTKGAEELQGLIGVTFPGAEVMVDPLPDGADVAVVLNGDHHRYRIYDNDLDSPIVRLLIGAALT